MVLNKNPENYFAEVEQIAFCPAHMPPGIEASPDKMLQVTQLMLITKGSLHCSLILEFCLEFIQDG